MKAKVKEVKVDFRSRASIIRAERYKARLENAGYRYERAIGTFDVFRLIYRR